VKLFKCSYLFLTCVLLWADVKGSPEDEQAVREFLRHGTGSTLDKKEREIMRAQTLSEQNIVENVDFLNIYGGWVQGRQTYVDRMNSPQARAAFDGKTRDAIVESIRFLRPDVVVAIVRFHNHKQDGKPTGEETRASFVLTKENGRWKLNAFHNTTIQYGRGGNPARP
jgi:uncharacterized protein (TIGR02246 family)